MSVHLAFDLLAVVTALALGVGTWRWRFADLAVPITTGNRGYVTLLGLGLTLGSFSLGTANLVLSGVPMVGRSVLGALVGAIIAVEIYKWIKGINGSTGGVFVPVFATLIIVGRIGCALSGLEDQTFGLPSSLPWAVDMGDGILRHPVAIYESLSMGVFLITYLIALAIRAPWAIHRGFYVMVGFYGAQRFLWEFLKPYSTLIGPFNLFHFATAGLMAYAFVMFYKSARYEP